MKFIKIIFILTLLILFSLQSALACQCYTLPPPCYNYSKFDAVFVGTVKNVEKDSPENNFMPKVEIEVEENFKGMKNQKAFTRNYGHSCAWGFNKDDKFLFYGNLDEKEENHFSTSFCTRTQRFEDNLSDFEFLKSLKNSTPNYWIWGTVSKGYQGFGSSIEGIKAEVFDNKKTLTGISDKDGNLKIVVSKEGTYKVRVYTPKGTGINISQWEEQRDLLKRGGKNKKGRYVEYEVEVKNNKCGWFDAVVLR